jgi:hypothetical protein
MSGKNSLFRQLITSFREKEENDLPPEVCNKSDYSYTNFRGDEPSSFGPRYEAKEAQDNETEVFTSRVKPQIEFCRQ